MKSTPFSLGIYMEIVFLLLNGIGVTQSQLFTLSFPNKCQDVCPMAYRVVCALDVLDGCFRTFSSSCVMRIYNCKYQKAYKIIAQRACEFLTIDELHRKVGNIT